MGFLAKVVMTKKNNQNNNNNQHKQHLYEDALIESLKDCSKITPKTGTDDCCKSCMFSKYLTYQSCVDIALDYAANEIEYLCDTYNNLVDEFYKIKNAKLSEKKHDGFVGNIDIERELKNRLCLDNFYRGNFSDIDLLNFSLIAIEELKEENKQLKKANHENTKETKNKNDKTNLIRTILNSAENIHKYYSFGWNDAIDNILEIGKCDKVGVADVFNKTHKLRKKEIN